MSCGRHELENIAECLYRSLVLEPGRREATRIAMAGVGDN